MDHLTKQEMDYAIAKERVNQLKKFYGSVLIFAVLLAIYSFRNYYLKDNITLFHFEGFSGIFWIWGILLTIKAVKLIFLNPSWERKMIDKQLKS